MRITQGMITDNTLRNLMSNLSRLDTYSNQLTSGKRISKPSDDPVGAAAALGYRADLEQLDQHLKNLDEAQSWVRATDSALDQAGTSIVRALELATNGATDSLAAQDRLAIKVEIDALSAHMVQLANSAYGNQYLFAGTATTTPAYVAGTPPTYAGNTAAINREIAPGTVVTINLPGSTTFDPAFTALNDLSAALAADDTAAIQNALTAVQGAQTALLTSRAQIGARDNRMEAQRERLLDLQANVSGLRAKAEDADYTATIANFTTAETVYKAALAVGARSVQPSLMDYLR